MEKDPFSLFIDLINFDQKIFASESKIKNIQKEVSNLKNDIISIQSTLEISKNNWNSAKKEVDQNELKMRELDNLEKQKKEKLENIQGPKEYNALKKEIEKIKQLQYELEPQLVENWNKHDISKKEYESKKEEIEKKINEIEAVENQKLNEIKTNEEEVKNLTQERKVKEQNIPQEWIDKYYIMRTRVSNPVVPMKNESCTACFYALTSQDLINLKHKKLMQCKKCYRFLYSEK